MPQRLRVTYRKDGPARYVAHLDVMRTWERAIRRAGLPLAYSQGFSPHARLQLAAPLPVGTIGERELLDLWLDEPVAPLEAGRRLAEALPPGLEVVEVEEIGDRLPALQASLRAARYEVRFGPRALDVPAAAAAIERLLALEELPWEEARGDRTRSYLLRATIFEMRLRPSSEGDVIEMRLAMADGLTGRPASILAALAVEAEPDAIVRTEVEVDRPQVAMRAWRERGRFED
ncbi:MAG: TIGR03936 family radical SAM-associated protein [Dehalococcoidia bacterium]